MICCCKKRTLGAQETAVCAANRGLVVDLESDITLPVSSSPSSLDFEDQFWDTCMTPGTCYWRESMSCRVSSGMPGSKDSNGSLLSSGRQTLACLASQLAPFVALRWLDDIAICGEQ